MVSNFSQRFETISSVKKKTIQYFLQELNKIYNLLTDIRINDAMVILVETGNNKRPLY